MKYLIYELFSGVGLCNQLFSLETGIYLASLTNRKLILLIKNPLCHCGKSTWDYGYLLNFFTSDFLKYLPNGFEVYYQKSPKEIEDIIRNTKKTKTFKYSSRFSNLVFVDKELDTPENQKDISKYCHSRSKEYLGFPDEKVDEFEYFYIYQTNASRCFYNFYTTPENYELMYNICESLKFKPVFYEMASNIYSTLTSQRNQFNIFLHLRFGDQWKDEKFLGRYNTTMITHLSQYIDGHVTNLIKPNIYVLCDNKKNKYFFDRMKRFNLQFIDQHTNNYIKTFIEDKNKMLYYDFNKPKKYEVATAVLEMILCSYSDEFVGTVTSTFSHYIQYLRYYNNKNFSNYSNLSNNKNVQYCKLMPVKDSDIEWIKHDFRGGHPVSWWCFWDIKHRPENKVYFTIEGKIDGFGSQLHACFSLIAYCDYRGYNYVHTPMYRMHHNDEKRKDFPQYMNNFINFESKYKTINDLTNYEKTKIQPVKEGMFVHGSYHPEFFYNESVLAKIRDIYYSTPKPDVKKELNYDDKAVNIAVHIRRGDVDAKKYPTRFTANSVYIDLITKILKSSQLQQLRQPQSQPEKQVAIHIFSQGKDDDFKDIVEKFPELNIGLHINTNIQTTFHGMVSADMLVLGKSSYSYCAALLNKNITVANLITNWWHKPLKQWIKV